MNIIQQCFFTVFTVADSFDVLHSSSELEDRLFETTRKHYVE